jgi:hypothetical protein
MDIAIICILIILVIDNYLIHKKLRKMRGTINELIVWFAEDEADSFNDHVYSERVN